MHFFRRFPPRSGSKILLYNVSSGEGRGKGLLVLRKRGHFVARLVFLFAIRAVEARTNAVAPTRSALVAIGVLCSSFRPISHRRHHPRPLCCRKCHLERENEVSGRGKRRRIIRARGRPFFEYRTLLFSLSLSTRSPSFPSKPAAAALARSASQLRVPNLTPWVSTVFVQGVRRNGMDLNAEQMG